MEPVVSAFVFLGLSKPETRDEGVWHIFVPASPDPEVREVIAKIKKMDVIEDEEAFLD